jgi:hypothetical protein
MIYGQIRSSTHYFETHVTARKETIMPICKKKKKSWGGGGGGAKYPIFTLLKRKLEKKFFKKEQ